MTDQTPFGNSFRAAVLGGERRLLVVEEKTPRLDSSLGESLDGSMVPRTEARHADHRDQDRHRLSDETATVRYKRKPYEVEIINLSSGGAMIRGDFAPNLWDLIELELGDGPRIEAAVRWIKGDCMGVEFAHETQIECDPKMRAELLLEVIQRSFPDAIELEMPELPESNAPAFAKEEDDPGNRAETRHPLVWSGQILFAFDSNPVRLRNISSGGALVDVQMIYPVGSEVMLDLGEAGQFDAVVSWAQGEQAGLKFAKPFDLACLAKLRPDLTPYHWERPSFLDRADAQEEESTPWDGEWRRRSLADLHTELEGFLKH